MNLERSDSRMPSHVRLDAVQLPRNLRESLWIACVSHLWKRGDTFEILTGGILFLLAGSLYHMTRSLHLVGALHGTLNYVPALLGAWTQSLDRAIVYGLALGLVLLFAQVVRRNKEKAPSWL